MTDSDYEPGSWARRTSLGRRVFNHNFRMRTEGPPGWSLLKAVPMAKDAKLAEITWLWQAKAAHSEALVQVNVAELKDWRSAQKHLLAMLDHCMRPAIPPGSRDLADVGDVIFVAPDPLHDAPASAQFARGNIAAAVRSVGSIAVDVSVFAKLVDHMLSSSPQKDLAQPFERRLLQITPQENRAVTELPVKLDQPDVWLKVIASSGELRRKGRTIEHVASANGPAIVDVIEIR